MVFITSLASYMFSYTNGNYVNYCWKWVGWIYQYYREFNISIYWTVFNYRYFKYFFLLYSLSITIGALLSVVLFFVVSRVHPHWILQIILGTAGFVMSIAWLNIEANEVVSVLESFGLAFSIDTGNNYIHVLIY